MENNAGRIGARIEQIAAELTALARDLSGDSADSPRPKSPPEVAEKLARRQCLQTGKIVLKGKPYRRGLSVAAYDRTMTKLKSGELTEGELIAAGLLAEVRAGGPKPESDALTEFIATRQSRPTQTDQAKQIADELKTVPINEPERPPTKKRRPKK